MVSIIVPVYNVEGYLKRCVDSILSQTYSNIEIILIDDGSTDSSGQLCDEYQKKDNRIKVEHKQNGGLSSARNAGLDIATGDYIAFIDSDDWVEPNFIERLRTLLIETNSDMSACTFCRTKGDIAQRLCFDTSVEIITNKKFDCAFKEESYAGYACNKMFKREIFEKNELRFDEKIFHGEDSPFVVEFLQYVQKIAFTKEDLYYYYFREDSITKSVRLTDKYLSILYAREKTMALLKERNEKCYDVCKAAYLDILSKIKFMAMIDKSKYFSIYQSTREKIKTSKKGLFSLRGVGLKRKLKLFIMIYFPKIVSKRYNKKIKVA